MVDREREQRQLLAAAETVPALVVMIGRRRVGKSFLLDRTFTGDRVVSFQGDEQDERHHLDLFGAEVGRVLLGTDALGLPTWDAAFDLLASLSRQQPLTVVLDELQWIKRAQPAIDSVLQRHWDRWDRERAPITLVLASSALTLMEQLLERGSPLYGRATARPWLFPLDYREAAGFATGMGPEELLRRWAVVGGTPQYQVWAGDGPLGQVLAERVLAKDAPLYDEPRHLLREGESIRDRCSRVRSSARTQCSLALRRDGGGPIRSRGTGAVFAVHRGHPAEAVPRLSLRVFPGNWPGRSPPHWRYRDQQCARARQLGYRWRRAFVHAGTFSCGCDGFAWRGPGRGPALTGSHFCSPNATRRSAVGNPWRGDRRYWV
jgi:hypothetical protein